MSSSWIKVALNPMTPTRVLVKDRGEEAETQRRSHVKTEAEMGGTRLQAQGCLEPQKLEEAVRTLPWILWRELSPAPPGSQ